MIKPKTTMDNFRYFKGLKSMKEKLTNIWLWTIAIAMAVVMVCTAMAWIVGIVVFVMRWLNG